MIIELLALFGLFFGIIISHYTQEELKDGKKYFMILEFIILIVLFFLTTRYNINTIFLALGIIIGFLVRNPYLFFGILLGSVANLNFLYSGLIFVYGLADGSLWFINKSKNYLYLSVALFFVQFILYFFGYTLLSFVNGGFIGVTLYKVYDELIVRQIL